MIDDATYFVIEEGDGENDRIVAAGGWSYRKTLFGSDQAGIRNAEHIDPATDAAKIRAFFVDPDCTRRGLASQLLNACERAARDAGYRQVELMATLPGQRLYQSRGYVSALSILHDLGEGVTIKFVPMSKRLA